MSLTPLPFKFHFLPLLSQAFWLSQEPNKNSYAEKGINRRIPGCSQKPRKSRGFGHHEDALLLVLCVSACPHSLGLRVGSVCQAGSQIAVLHAQASSSATRETTGWGPVVGLAGSSDCHVARGLSLLPEKPFGEGRESKSQHDEAGSHLSLYPLYVYSLNVRLCGIFT